MIIKIITDKFLRAILENNEKMPNNNARCKIFRVTNGITEIVGYANSTPMGTVGVRLIISEQILTPEIGDSVILDPL